MSDSDDSYYYVIKKEYIEARIEYWEERDRYCAACHEYDPEPFVCSDARKAFDLACADFEKVCQKFYSILRHRGTNLKFADLYKRGITIED